VSERECFGRLLQLLVFAKIFHPLMVEEKKKLRQLVHWVPRARADAAPS